ncbi:MAG: hypothetical protein ACRDP9_11860 [Kribbellaceae bacterium]
MQKLKVESDLVISVAGPHLAAQAMHSGLVEDCVVNPDKLTHLS